MKSMFNSCLEVLLIQHTSFLDGIFQFNMVMEVKSSKVFLVKLYQMDKNYIC